MELNILIGAIAGALVGPALASIYARWPSGISLPAGNLICRNCTGELRRGWSLPLTWLPKLHGQCLDCGNRIDPALPAIELLAVAIGVVAAGWSGSPALALASALLGWQLLLLGALDLSDRWLPDLLNLLLAVTGLGLAAVLANATLPDRLLGLATGYLSLELIRRGYRRLRGRDGLGGGDPKLFAAIGCWVGWQWLPWVLVLAAIGGLVAAAVMILAGRRNLAETRLPLGTMLALATWPVWLLAQP